MKLLRMIYIGWGLLCAVLIANPAFVAAEYYYKRRQTSVRDSSKPQDSQ